MEVTYFLVPVAVLMSTVSLALFVWALRSGQFDDMEGPRWRILFDEPDNLGDSPRAGGGSRTSPPGERSGGAPGSQGRKDGCP